MKYLRQDGNVDLPPIFTPSTDSETSQATFQLSNLATSFV